MQMHATYGLELRRLVRGDLGSRLTRFLLVLMLAFPTGLAAPSAAFAAQDTSRVSVVTGTGHEANAESEAPSISADGRYMVFESWATNLVPGGTNGKKHVYRHDRVSGETKLVSVSTAGIHANQNCSNPTVSGDGRYVAFESMADNLVASDTNASVDVFVRDMQENKTTRVSVSSGGVQADASCENAMISGNGEFVVFDSSATNLAGDTNQRKDVFIRALKTNQTTLVSLKNGSATDQADGHSAHPAVSADGRYVAFESRATNLVTGTVSSYQQIYVRDRTTNTTTRRSVSGITPGNSDSQHPVISGNGLVVAFETFATNLGGTNPAAAMDVIVSVGTTCTRVNRATTGVLGNNSSLHPSLSHDGRYVAFDSASSNLVTADTNNKDDMFVCDRTNNTTTRVSVSSGGAQGDGHSRHGSITISSDGAIVVIVVYESQATNLVAGDTNGVTDVFASREIVAPSGTIKINGGASATNSPDVTVAHTVDWKGGGAGQMRHSVNGGASWVGGGEGWVTYATTRALTLPAGEGTKTVRVEFKDASGRTSLDLIKATILLDTTPPTGSITLDGGAQYATSKTVTLTSNVNFAVAGAQPTQGMRVSVDGGATWGEWGPYAASKQITLPDGDGPKTVLAEFKDAAGNVSAPLSAPIVLDTTPPTGSITLNGGAQYATTLAVTLASNVDFGVTDAHPTQGMRVSVDGGDTWGTWGPYAASKQITLTGADGAKTVRVEFKDAAGNIAAKSASIVLDTTPPTGTIKINGGAKSTGSPEVKVTNVVDFGPSGAHATQAMRHSADGGATWGAWEPYAPTKYLTLPEGDGPKTVLAEFRDAAGNIAAKSASIVLDTAPVPSRKIEEDAAGVTFDRFVTGKSGEYSGGAYIYGRWAGTRMQMRFTGDTVRLYGPKQPNYGMADVYVDGIKKATVDAYADGADKTLSAQLFEVAGLTDGPHTLEVRITGQKNPASTATIVVFDYFEVEAKSASADITRIDELSGTLAGPWVRGNNPTYYGGSYHYSRYPNASFQASFTGTKVVWIGPKTGAYGRAKVYVDGVLQGTVSQRGTMGWRERVWESEALTRGKHTIEIRPTGTKDPASKSTNVVIDALDVTE